MDSWFIYPSREITIEIMWLSIIIPLYNCAPYIGMCLDSILQQGLSADEYEVVVIDDGSTDGGADLVENNYCRLHSQIHVVRQTNGGAAAARNRGIMEAQGEYIEFVDADDRLLPGGIATLRNAYLADGHRPDMVSMGMYTVDRYYDPAKFEHINDYRTLFEGTFLDFGRQFPFGWSSVSRIIKRQTLIDSGVRFKGYAISEDVLFIMSLFEALPGATIVATNLSFYRYMVREGSALTNTGRDHNIRAVNGYIELFGIVSRMRDCSLYPKERFEGDLFQFRRASFIRLVTSHLRLSDVRMLLGKARAAGLFPLSDTPGRFEQAVNRFTPHSFATWLVSLPLRYIYPIVKPWIRRN